MSVMPSAVAELNKQRLASDGETGLISKIDTERRIAYGFASITMDDGQPLVDRQGHVIDTDDLEAAVNEFMHNVRASGEMHTGEAIGTVIESVVYTHEKLAAMGVPDAVAKGLHGKWWIGVRVNDDSVWAKVRSGHLRAFSIQGQASRRPVEIEKALGAAPSTRTATRLRKLRLDRVDLVDEPACPGALVTLLKAVPSPERQALIEQDARLAALERRQLSDDDTRRAAIEKAEAEAKAATTPPAPVAVDYAKLARLDSGEMARVVKAVDASIVRARADLRAGRVSLAESDTLRFTAPEGEPEIARAMHLAEYRERGIIDARGYCVSRGTESRIGEAL